jgi:putative hydrolase of the HAD superfamily
MPAYRAVLFDFFGTLTQAVRRGPRHAAIAKILGCDPATLTAVLDRSFYTRARGLFGSAEAALAWVCEQAGGRPSRTALRTALAMRVRAVREDTTLRPDAVAALTALRRRGVRTAVVSDCAYELPEFLPWLPVGPLLGACAFSVYIGQCKPHAAMYLTACDQLRVRPEECLYVGDGGSRELSGAAALGLDAVRLAAPDLDGHLVFNAETDWAGPSVRTLTEAVRIVDPVPVLV